MREAEVLASYPSIAAIKNATEDRAARRGGGHWFGAAEMRFFGTRVESPVIAGALFITSEQPPNGPRAYAVRKANEDGEIDTVWAGEGSGVCAHATLNDALVYAVGFVLFQTTWHGVPGRDLLSTDHGDDQYNRAELQASLEKFHAHS